MNNEARQCLGDKERLREQISRERGRIGQRKARLQQIQTGQNTKKSPTKSPDKDQLVYPRHPEYLDATESQYQHEAMVLLQKYQRNNRIVHALTKSIQSQQEGNRDMIYQLKDKQAYLHQLRRAKLPHPPSYWNGLQP